MHSLLVFSPPWELNFGLPTRKASFETLIHTPVSKRGEIRGSLQPYPEWVIEYELNYARDLPQMPNSVYQYMLGFSIAMGGQFSDFLFLDQTENAVEQSFIGTGDGTTTNFQLIRQIGNLGNDIVQSPVTAPLPTVYINGVPTTDFSMGFGGILQFNAPPAVGSIITWSGAFYFRVRFDDDGLNFEQFMERIWSCRSVKLRSVLL